MNNILPIGVSKSENSSDEGLIKGVLVVLVIADDNCEASGVTKI